MCYAFGVIILTTAHIVLCQNDPWVYAAQDQSLK